MGFLSKTSDSSLFGKPANSESEKKDVDSKPSADPIKSNPFLANSNVQDNPYLLASNNNPFLKSE